jgi:hypothetical protein
MLGRVVNGKFYEGRGIVEKGGLVRWVSLTLTSIWWRVGLPSAMLGQLGEKLANVFEIYHDGMAEMEKSMFLRCTKNDFSASATVHQFRKPKD